MTTEEYLRCADLVYSEAKYIDQQRWDDWLALYLEEAEYWIPAWDREHELVTDPKKDISLIYYSNRSGLEDRVFRIRTNLSSATNPLARTSHLVANVQAQQLDSGDYFVESRWQTTSFRHKQTYQFAGYYEHTLRPVDDGELRIAKKKIVVINDLIPNVLDVYSV